MYVEVAVLGHIETTRGMMSELMAMKMGENKWLRPKCTKIALQKSHLPVSLAKIMGGAATHPI